MTDDLSKNNSSELALPMGKIRVPKFLYIILIVLGVLVLIIGGFYLYLENSPKKTSVDKTLTNNRNAVEVSDSEIAKSIINWLDNERDDRELYWSFEKCSKNDGNNCFEKVQRNDLGISVMWGMNRYYLSTNDKSILEIIKSDIDNYRDETKTPSIGTSHLFCKLIDEIKKNKNLDETDKSNLDYICVKAEYPDGINYNVYNQTIEEIKPSVNYKISVILDSDTDKFNYSSNKYTELFGQNIVTVDSLNFASDYIYKNKTLSDGFFLRKAYLIFDIGLDLFLTDSMGRNKDKFVCRIGRLALDLNGEEKNDNYKELAKKLFSWYSNTYSWDCVMLADELYQETGDEKFLKYKNDYLLSLRNKITKSVVENGFVTGLEEGTEEKDAYKNGLFIGLLSK